MVECMLFGQVDDLPSIRKRYLNSFAFPCDLLGILPLKELYCLAEAIRARFFHHHPPPSAPLPSSSAPAAATNGRLRKTEVHSSLVGLFSALQMAKLFRLRHFRDMWRLAVRRLPRNSRLLMVLRLMLTVLFVGHLLACAWFIVGRIGSGGWVHRMYRAQTPSRWSWLSKYISSLYFVYSTVTTVGYGDLAATTIYERCIGAELEGKRKGRAFCIGAMVIGSFVFGLLIGSVPDIVDTRMEAYTRYLDFETDVKEYLHGKRVPAELKGRILQYYEFRFPERRLHDRPAIFAAVPDEMAKDLACWVYRDLVAVCPLLKRASRAFCSEACLKFRKEWWPRDDTIFEEGEPIDGVCFIRTGQVKLSRRGMPFAELGPGDVFGDNLMDLRRPASAPSSPQLSPTASPTLTRPAAAAAAAAAAGGAARAAAAAAAAAVGLPDAGVVMVTATATDPVELCRLGEVDWQDLVAAHAQEELAYHSDMSLWPTVRARILRRRQARLGGAPLRGPAGSTAGTAGGGGGGWPDAATLDALRAIRAAAAELASMRTPPPPAPRVLQRTRTPSVQQSPPPPPPLQPPPPPPLAQSFTVPAPAVPRMTPAASRTGPVPLGSAPFVANTTPDSAQWHAPPSPLQQATASMIPATTAPPPSGTARVRPAPAMGVGTQLAQPQPLPTSTPLRPQGLREALPATHQPSHVPPPPPLPPPPPPPALWQDPYHSPVLDLPSSPPPQPISQPPYLQPSPMLPFRATSPSVGIGLPVPPPPPPPILPTIPHPTLEQQCTESPLPPNSPTMAWPASVGIGSASTTSGAASAAATSVASAAAAAESGRATSIFRLSSGLPPKLPPRVGGRAQALVPMVELAPEPTPPPPPATSSPSPPPPQLASPTPPQHRSPSPAISQPHPSRRPESSSSTSIGTPSPPHPSKCSSSEFVS